jgi:hypothetical protein
MLKSMARLDPDGDDGEEGRRVEHGHRARLLLGVAARERLDAAQELAAPMQLPANASKRKTLYSALVAPKDFAVPFYMKKSKKEDYRLELVREQRQPAVLRRAFRNAGPRTCRIKSVGPPELLLRGLRGRAPLRGVRGVVGCCCDAGRITTMSSGGGVIGVWRLEQLLVLAINLASVFQCFPLLFSRVTE